MSHPPSSRARRAPFVIIFALFAALAGGACSSSDAPMPEDISTVTLPPPTDGANCTDPAGDISDSAQQVAGTLREPPGVDILAARADVSDTDMTVTFEVAGPIAEVPEPLFYVGQGPPGLEASFELRIAPDEAGTWVASLITWSKESGSVVESDPKPLSAPVTVAGDQLSVTVPLTELPKIVTLVWQFGAAADLPPVPGATTRRTVLDDCNNMSDQTGPGSSVPTTVGVTPSTEVPSGVLDTPLVSNDGVIVRVFSYQNPPTDPAPTTVAPTEGFELAVIEVEVCGGGTDTTVRPGNFRLLTVGNELWNPWEVPEAATTPAFPTEAGTLPAGECRRGWITYELPIDTDITDVVFTPDSGADGTGTVIWTV